MKKNLNHIKCFENFQSIAVSSLYDSGSLGAFNRFKNENPTLELEEEIQDDVLYHATNYTWDIPEIKYLGFHAGTLKAAQDRMKSFRMKINPHILILRIHLKNPLYLNRDYRFHDNLTKVATELYKDDVINKSEKDDFIRVYSDYATFDNLRKLLYEKYGYDGIVYRNNIEDRGSMSYIAFFPEQIEILGSL